MSFAAMTALANRLCLALGVVLVLGGLAHSFGVSRLYLTRGVPDLNRVLLDIWIAEAQLVGGALLLVSRRRSDPRPWVLAGALLIWTYALPFVPVLIQRARPIFWIMPTLYSALSLWAVLSSSARSTR
jgi:hypothetical protein